MALNSGSLERRDEALPLYIQVSEEEEEVTLTLWKAEERCPIAFLTHQQEAAMKHFDENSTERILAAVSKRLLQLKAVKAKEQPIMIFFYGRRAG